MLVKINKIDNEEKMSEKEKNRRKIRKKWQNSKIIPYNLLKN